MSDDKLMILTSTFPDRVIAEKTAHHLVDAGLAVCAQVGADLTSYYRWEGAVQKGAEVAVTFKVLASRFPLFCGELELKHPYDVPQMIGWTADHVSASYARWAEGGDT